jgi:hypothetical protein
MAPSALANVQSVYDVYRLHHGVMDSIRFTASAYGVSAIDVARVLGLASYFISHR